jgi:chromosome segregation ATPase
MNCASKALLVLTAIGMVGLWGCSQNKGGTANSRIRDLEARHAKLEEDYRAVVAANDGFRKRLAQAETQRAELAKQVKDLEIVVRERDELKKQLVTRTGERDNLHAQLVQFGRELQGLMGKVEAATNGQPPAPPATSAAATVSREKS